MPRVRFIASRVAAKTSGTTSSRARWMRSCSFLRRALGRLVRLGGLVDLLADHLDAAADLLFGERLELSFEGARLVDHWLDASDLAVVRVDETVEKAQDHSR